MCRLFGIHSLSRTRVHQALVAADNALMVQGKCHNDGWGIAYYLNGIPHLLKSPKSASADEDFSLLAQSINSPTVIAHVRQATQGALSLLNCHPFQYGSWVMAHNGDCPSFQITKNELIEDLDIEFRAHLFGSTDSEIFFALLLNDLKKKGLLGEYAIQVRDVASSVRTVVDRLERLYEQHGLTQGPSLNLVVSNGNMLLAYRLGRTLFYSFATPNEAGEGQPVNHLLICSEPLSNDSTWQSFAERQIVAVDKDMRLFFDL